MLDPDDTALELQLRTQALRIAQLEYEARRLALSGDEARQYVKIFSHDLQEPLRTIKTYVDFVADLQQEQSDEDLRTALGYLRDSADRMQSLIWRMMRYMQIGRRGELARVDLADVAEEVRFNLEPVLKERGARLNVDCAGAYVEGFRNELILLLQNLVHNAVIYAKPGMASEVELRGARKADGCQVSVSDNGIGIADVHREKIFDLFSRLHNRDSYEGLGTGLAECKKVAILHHGRMWVEPGPQGGSVFSVTLMDLAEEDVAQWRDAR